VYDGILFEVSIVEMISEVDILLQSSRVEFSRST
jgi:hypothetical protein